MASSGGDRLRITAQVWWEAIVAGFWVSFLNWLERRTRHRWEQQVRVYRDLVYAEQDGVPVRLDLFLPQTPPPEDGYLTVIALHGGAWCSGSKRDMAWMGYWLARRGVAVACVGYRLAPQFRFPAQWHDCQAAVRWLREHALQWHLNAEGIVAFGISSGGHLALLLGVRGSETKGDKVAKVAALFPPTDLTAPYYRDAARHPPPLLPNYLLHFLGATYEEAPDRWRDASPIFHVHPRAAPCFLIQGTKDLLVPPDQAIRFVEAMRKAGAKATLVLIEGLGHGYSLRPSLMRQLNNALDAAVNFLLHP